MADNDNIEFFELVGYEMRLFDESISLRLTYGEPGDEPGPKDCKTPTLFLTPDEARELARDLILSADKIEPASSSDAAPLH